MVTDPRNAVFGRVVDAKVERSLLGEKVFEALEAIPAFNPGLKLFEHELMPDHLHCNLYLPPVTPDRAGEAGQGEAGQVVGSPESPALSGVDEANRAQLQRLGVAMRRFKTYTTTLARKMIGASALWQQGYHDRICMSRRFIEAVSRYIRYNALKYELMYNQSEFMKIREPLAPLRLDAEDFWKGMGNVVLLESRNASFIHVLPSCMKNGHRPDSRYLKPLSNCTMMSTW